MNNLAKGIRLDIGESWVGILGRKGIGNKMFQGTFLMKYLNFTTVTVLTLLYHQHLLLKQF